MAENNTHVLYIVCSYKSREKCTCKGLLYECGKCIASNNNLLRFSLPYFTSTITSDVSTYVSFSIISHQCKKHKKIKCYLK